MRFFCDSAKCSRNPCSLRLFNLAENYPRRKTYVHGVYTTLASQMPLNHEIQIVPMHGHDQKEPNEQFKFILRKFHYFIGLISSTILTLVVVPVVYVLLDNLASSFKKKKE